MSIDEKEFATPLGTSGRGRLEFARGASRVSVSADGEMPDLLRARFTGVVPMVLADDGRVTIEYPRIAPSEWLRPNRRSASLTLNPAVPWELVFGGGVSKLQAELGAVSLRGLEIRGGASDLEIVLPAPRGVVVVRVAGGVSKLVLRRPHETAASLSIGGGVSELVFDEQRVGSTGGGSKLESAGASQAPDRYEIEIGGGASEVTIVETE
jgi:hypothetical protein